MSRACGLSLAAFSLLLALAGCATAPAPTTAAPGAPPAPREFRGAWIASVANIDWPSKPGLTVDQLRAEMRAMLDRARSLRLNAVILQVRPAADALYASELEPWSEYLTGEQGRAPAAGYDPLAEWVREAHARGLELHAWLNPYRARHPSARSPLAPSHLARTRPEAVKAYGDLLWMDPAEPAAVERTLAVVADIVRRYDVDGIHIDDYFYPYPVNAPAPPGTPAAERKVVEFPDEPAWQRYVAGGGKLSRADWRRQNVDHLVEEMNRVVHATRPGVKFGVSPFGVGRPDRRPPGITGFSQYDQIYANVELWLARGWMDYLAPQLYWPARQKGQQFDVLLDYWLGQNPAGRHIWPGLFTSSINDTPKSWPAEEIVGQVDLARSRPGATGHVHFSMVALLQDRKGVSDRLGAGPYAEPALVPATPWLEAEPPAAPTLVRRRVLGLFPSSRVTIVPAAGEAPAVYAVWRRQAGRWRFAVQPAAEPVVDLDAPGGAGAVEMLAISAVDRLGNESGRAALVLRAEERSR